MIAAYMKTDFGDAVPLLFLVMPQYAVGIRRAATLVAIFVSGPASAAPPARGVSLETRSATATWSLSGGQRRERDDPDGVNYEVDPGNNRLGNASVWGPQPIG